MKRKIKISVVFLLAACLVAASYCVFASVFMIGESYTVVENGSVDAYLPYLISADKNASVRVQSSGKLSGGVVESDGHTDEVCLKFLGIIPVKTVSVSIVKTPAAVISGECIGVKLYADGLITVGVTDFESADGKRVSPAKDAGVRAGDIIKSINGSPVGSTSQFLKTLDRAGECAVTVERDGKNIDFRLTPKASTDGHKRIGVWVRDSVAGIGTLTFSDAQTGKFATLGHGIADSDTDVLIPIKNGTLHSATILGITKGKKGAPGEIIGSLNDGKKLGKCEKNLQIGIYGSLYDIKSDNVVEIAPSSEVQKGDAAIVCTIDDEGPKQYSVKILNISRLTGGTKSMIVRITDPRLISKTGGIVQGMSGSPLIQNGRLIGAVTHVFVNDPLKGYAIFAETMLSELSK